jgi:hypothetical protein
MGEREREFREKREEEEEDEPRVFIISALFSFFFSILFSFSFSLFFFLVYFSQAANCLTSSYWVESFFCFKKSSTNINNIKRKQQQGS